MIQWSDIHLSLKGQPVLRGFDLTPVPGQLNLLIGSNGAGKSTALKVAAGLWRPRSGELRFESKVMHHRESRFGRIAYLPQSPLFHPRLRVRELIRFYARLEGADLSEAEIALERFGLEAHRHHRSVELSGGLRQRLGLAILSLSSAPVWLLDEPGLSLDPLWRRKLQSWLKEASSSGRTVLAATHLLAEWEGRADTCYLCENGRIDGELDPAHLREAHLRLEGGFGTDRRSQEGVSA
ncbi:MAG: ATP-binding cassette domain-containing protein [Verrucomicrobia bacterium]|jgi:ABC-type multidrug transport system ATPase subunit|nr:ATP-binding cassette domain-containing protein [Verrucomicrobiota bacterium]